MDTLQFHHFFAPVHTIMLLWPTMSQVRTSSIRVPRHSQKLYILPILIAMCGSNHTKKEKEGLQRLDVYESISKKQYLHLKCTGRVGKALGRFAMTLLHGVSKPLPPGMHMKPCRIFEITDSNSANSIPAVLLDAVRIHLCSTASKNSLFF